ncbi:MAG TPA: hypothetical protein VL371_24160, partial [Gemmataceae bacterium]|nr:hypothetical protein [Gemmataceae bacterium]
MKTSHLTSGLGLGLGLALVAGGATGCGAENYGATQARGAGRSGELKPTPPVSGGKGSNHRDAIEAVNSRIRSQMQAVESAAPADSSADLSGSPVVGFVDPRGLTLSTD